MVHSTNDGILQSENEWSESDYEADLEVRLINEENAKESGTPSRDHKALIRRLRRESEKKKWNTGND